VGVKPVRYFSNDDVIDSLIAKGLTAKFIAAAQARDRDQLISLLIKVSRDKGGQTAEVLADLYLADSRLFARLTG
jgi:hypothetical protein